MRKRVYIFVLVASFLGICLPPKELLAVSFQSDLLLGSNSQEVLFLQRFLNTVPTTQIATVGPGSPGQETTYFGNLTKAAVIKFQESHASEVLSPVGLIRGTGYVGPLTRKKINALVSQEVKNLENTTPPAAFLLQADPSTSLPGSFVVLKGLGFINQGYTVFFEDGKTGAARYFDTKTLTFAVPQGVAAKKHELVVRDEEGVALQNTATLTVLPAGVLESSVRPFIESIDPNTGGEGTKVKIQGRDFDPQTRVNVGYGSITAPSSDGKTIEITLSPGWITDKPHGITMPLWIYVETERGESDPLIFNFQL